MENKNEEFTIRKFVIPHSASDEYDAADDGADETGEQLTDEQLLDQLLNDGDGGDDDDDDAGADEEAAAAAEAEAAKTKNAKDSQSQQNFAFGQLRAQNKELSDALMAIAAAQGIEAKNIGEAVKQLRSVALDKKAADTKIPKEYLEEMEELRSSANTFKQMQIQTKAESGFTTLATEYELSEDELMAFAKELDLAGKNPFEMEMDVVLAYQQSHMNDIIEKRTQKAVEEALKKSGKADAQSSVPAKKSGGGTGGTERITTQDGLSKLLASI